MYLCANCCEEINREEIEYYNGLPVHKGCRISAMIDDNCSKEEIINEMINLGLADDKEEAEYLLRDINF